MGEVETSGPGAAELLQRVLSNDVSKIEVGGAQYSVLCREDGGVLDDLFTYRLADDRFLTVTNASNHERDFAWFAEHAADFDCEVEDTLADWAMLAVQGPEARGGSSPASPRASYRLVFAPRRFEVAGAECLVCGTGYTGRGRRRDPVPARQRGDALGCAPGRGRYPRGPWSARHTSHGGLLPPLRQRPLRGPQPDRGRARLVLQGGDGFHRLGGDRGSASRRDAGEACSLRHPRAWHRPPGQRSDHWRRRSQAW